MKESTPTEKPWNLELTLHDYAEHGFNNTDRGANIPPQELADSLIDSKLSNESISVHLLLLPALIQGNLQVLLKEV